ncbi:RapZ C-terminal domain-containing protein [Streptomyces thinghirensis]|uniref:RapZ C-terminal domain-containing protein n=1 Tax=Streptomyces thinghirensis TaxID=551547 RepID=A0ABP9TEV0_9ACTN
MTALEIESFGFGHQAAPDAHLVIDLRRHFRDPHIRLDMRQLTAHDAIVRETVMNTPGIKQLLAGLVAAIEGFLAGPTQTVPVRVAPGCAGGRHRAATVALALYAVFSGDLNVAAELGVDDLAKAYVDRDLDVTLVHRDLDKPVIDR